MTPVWHVVYIEDNLVNIALMEALFETRRDISLHCFRDAFSALACAANFAPRLLLVDMQLPDMDGIELLARLRCVKTLRDVPAIVVSAAHLPEDRERAYAAGFIDFWVKPLDVRRVFATCDRLFSEKVSASASTARD